MKPDMTKARGLVKKRAMRIFMIRMERKTQELHAIQALFSRCGFYKNVV